MYQKTGAQKKTRTSTPLRALGPEPNASTNSAIWAFSPLFSRIYLNTIDCTQSDI